MWRGPTNTCTWKSEEKYVEHDNGTHHTYNIIHIVCCVRKITFFMLRDYLLPLYI